MIVVVALVFILTIAYICYIMQRNRKNYELEDRVLAQQIALAKQEGIEIPDDLEKRL